MAKRNLETGRKEVKTPKHSWYKRWKDMTDQEKAIEKYNRKGRPKIFWPSFLMKTHIKGSDIEKEFLEYKKDPVAYNKKKEELENQPTLEVAKD